VAFLYNCSLPRVKGGWVSTFKRIYCRKTCKTWPKW
jgi:hypothetical protein